MNRHHVFSKIKDNLDYGDAVYSGKTQLYKRMPENEQRHEIVNQSAKEGCGATFSHGHD